MQVYEYSHTYPSPARQQGDVQCGTLIPSLTVGAWMRFASLKTRTCFLELLLVGCGEQVKKLLGGLTVLDFLPDRFIGHGAADLSQGLNVRSGLVNRGNQHGDKRYRLVVNGGEINRFGHLSHGHDQLLDRVAFAVGNGQPLADAGAADRFTIHDGLQGDLMVGKLAGFVEQGGQFGDGFVFLTGLQGCYNAVKIKNFSKLHTIGTPQFVVTGMLKLVLYRFRDFYQIIYGEKSPVYRLFSRLAGTYDNFPDTEPISIPTGSVFPMGETSVITVSNTI